MTTTTNKLTVTKGRFDLKRVLSEFASKAIENIFDTGLTIVTLALLLWYLMLTVPDITPAYSGYIVAFYALILVRRLVQDFDDAYTLDELGEQLAIINNNIMQIQHTIEHEDVVITHVDGTREEIRL